MNGNELTTSYWNENKLTALIPDKLLDNMIDNEFQVIVKDNKDTIISSSEVYNIIR